MATTYDEGGMSATAVIAMLAIVGAGLGAALGGATIDPCRHFEHHHRRRRSAVLGAFLRPAHLQ